MRVTERCDRKCPFCYSKDMLIIPDAPVDDYYWGFYNFRAAGGREVGLMGGEPGCRKDLPQVLEAAKFSGLETTVYTNGKLRPAELFQMRDLIDHVSVSLDGQTADVNDGYRGRGQWQRAVDIIQWFQPDQVPFSLKVDTVVHAKNINKIDGIALLFDAKPIKWKLLQFVPRLKGFEVKDQFEISAEQFDEKVLLLQKRHPGKVITAGGYDPSQSAHVLIMRPDGTLQVDDGPGYKTIGNFFREPFERIATKMN